ncbi:MAG: DUF2752 domain-containing protein [Lawsonibacter sp.]|jgi:hypothetical protein
MPQALRKLHLFYFILLGIFCLCGCPFFNLFGVNCPGCGLTRAWLSFFCGAWRQAFQYHPLFLFAPGFLFLFIHRKAAFFANQSWVNFYLVTVSLGFAGYYFVRIALYFK